MLLIVSVTFAILLSPLISDMVATDNIETQYQAAQTFLTLLKRFIPALFAMLILILFHQISYTHRICGPLVNFGYTFRKIAEGDLTRKIKLRKGDYLQKESDEINKLQEYLITQITTARTDTDKLILFLEGLMDRIEDIDSKTKMDEVLKSLKQEAAKVKEDLSIFQTEEIKNESPE
jgi:methyl-accepting chemotaxis protein